MSLEINTQSIQQNIQQNQVQAPLDEYSRETLVQLKQDVQLATGQILSGRVTSLDGNNISLLLENKQSLSAHLNGDLPINVGQILSFEVRSNNGSQTELRPLYTNLTQESTIGAALSEASLPMTDRNVSMVEHMMEEGMPVNKQALMEMVDRLNAHPDVNPSTLVQMQKLNLPMDEATIRQFENYQNFEHQIENDVKDMNDGLAGLPEQMMAENAEGALSTAADILQMAFEDDGSLAAMNVDRENSFAQLLGLLQESGVVDAVEQEGILLTTESPEEKPVMPVVETLELEDAESDAANQSLENKNAMTQSHTSSHADKGDELLKLTARLMNEYRLDPDSFTKEDKELLMEALKNPLMKDALSAKLTAQLQLKPEDVAKDGKVEELYKKILEFSNKAMSLMNDTAMNSSQAMKSAQNLTDNVQFMNQLNEMMAYVQLPLKMSEENAHGDLYVYANKKKLAENDGNFSALLHLDMEHLGPMDVYVAMQQEKVSTHFYMQDEALLDFIEANIHILNERLTKKGYQMNTSVSVKEGAPNSVVDEFLKQESDGSVSPILSTMSFDVRA